MLELVGKTLAAHGVELWGVCALDELLPLIDCRQRRHLPAGARGVIVCAVPYRAREWPARNVCRYAVADDYHLLIGEILDSLCAAMTRRHPGASFARFVDNSPVREVAAAVRCGLGVRGRHNLLITARYGSWVHLGCAVTDLELPATQIGRPGEAACLDCGACLRACPTGAIGAGGFDRSRCRSAITQKKGALTDWETAQIAAGGLAWGCDLCQEVCPMNADRLFSPVPAFARNPVPVLGAANLPGALEAKAYGYRGRAVLERNLRLIGEDADRG